MNVSCESDLLILEELTNELTKPNPSEEKVKTYMKRAGLQYIEDPIERIDLVLNRLSFVETQEDINENPKT